MLARNFFLAFVPFLFATDAIGVLPMFVALTEDLDARMRRRVIGQMVMTALAVRSVFCSWAGAS